MAILVHLLGCQQTGDFPPAVFALDAAELLIGRLPECQINIPDDSISRSHARIYSDSGTWCIEDQNSHNGVYVNGQRVTNSRLLEGDIITTGDIYLTLSSHNADQIDLILPWLEERTQDALGYQKEILDRNALVTPEMAPSALIPTAPAEPSIAASPETPAPVVSTATQLPTPNITPPSQLPTPTITPPSSQAPHVPQAPALNPAHVPQQPVMPVAPANLVTPQMVTPNAQLKPAPQQPISSGVTPQANLNAIGKDYTIIIIVAVTGVILVVALIWRFTGLFG